MEFEMKQFDGKDPRAPRAGISRKGTTIAGVVAFIGVVVFLVTCYALAYPQMDRISHFDSAFRLEDEILVGDAIYNSPLAGRRGAIGPLGAMDYLLVLFDSQWEGEPIFIDIVSAEVIFFSGKETDVYSKLFLRDYALKLQDVCGNEYIVWRNGIFRCVYRNGERLLFEFLGK